MRYELKVNGKSQTIEAAEGTPLLWVLRDEMGLTGTKFGCGVASCGACTVHFNGIPARSCQLPVESAVGSEITTIEGANDGVANAVKEAWREEEVVQCGYCQSGQIMSAIGLLRNNKSPSETEIKDHMNGNVCRCATYARINNAVKLAAEKLEA